MGQDVVQGGHTGEVAVASLGVTGTLVLTFARPLAALPIPAEGTLCRKEAGR